MFKGTLILVASLLSFSANARPTALPLEHESRNWRYEAVQAVRRELDAFMQCEAINRRVVLQRYRDLHEAHWLATLERPPRHEAQRCRDS